MLINLLNNRKIILKNKLEIKIKIFIKIHKFNKIYLIKNLLNKKYNNLLKIKIYLE
jgi:hypothetical protein